MSCHRCFGMFNGVAMVILMMVSQGFFDLHYLKRKFVNVFKKRGFSAVKREDCFQGKVGYDEVMFAGDVWWIWPIRSWFDFQLDAAFGSLSPHGCFKLFMWGIANED
ncbi:hypothetical protein J1N35_046060 [Gossypium stocksii]|uniref:Uncharacterized protein n=1 Tax=Gossypium stocksii TaxID=47602 RepID=A0A9D3ZDR3_9ROSI|nr:hypothetical protein J1N35_046060 [Gossypium stocksii]